jgi:hypothetical protein
MAKVRLNPILERLSGAVGGLVFRQYGDGVVIARKPSFEGAEWSEAQLAARERFRQGALYGKAALADPAARAFYQAAAETRGKPVFSLMVADYLNAPSIEQIEMDGYAGNAGDEIVVIAHDDLGVTGVTVRVADDGDYPIEIGAAVESPAGSGRWVYRAQTTVESGMTVQVTATATDRPGGLARAYAEKTV